MTKILYKLVYITSILELNHDYFIFFVFLEHLFRNVMKLCYMRMMIGLQDDGFQFLLMFIRYIEDDGFQFQDDDFKMMFIQFLISIGHLKRSRFNF